LDTRILGAHVASNTLDGVQILAVSLEDYRISHYFVPMLDCTPS
jgi:hypothetical protein